MTLRVVEIHRVLKPTGSFYLHCDPTASHYLKLILDSVFCADGNGGEFLNEIIWWYDTGGMAKTRYSKKHDVIFIYAKSHSNYTFNVNEVKTLKNESSLNPGENSTYRLTDPEKYPHDVWQLHAINPKAKERLGYPTQKPEALLERVIRASSNEGDVVLDAYCGCGTTVAVSQRLNRRWIGIDITYQSISLILKRLEDQYPAQWHEIENNILLDGVPRDVASAVALANRRDDRTRKEFEKWAVLTFSKNQARINDKKGADAGVDGVAYFLIDKDENGKAIFQVKSGGATRATVATLNSDRQRENAEIGILITMDEPTKAMREEARAAKTYRHPHVDREDDRIQFVTVSEILSGRRLDLPMRRVDAVKSAPAVDTTPRLL
jgi:SAM-dependent methyltransferase